MNDKENSDQEEERLQDLEMESFNNLKQKIHDMFYNGCFLYYLNYDNFVDFINYISYRNIPNHKKEKKINEFIESHKNIFYETKRILGIGIDIDRYKEFVYDLSYKSCICKSLEEFD